MSGLSVFRIIASGIAPIIDPFRSLLLRPKSVPVVANRVSWYDTPQRSEEWHELRRNRLTTSTFSTLLGYWGPGRLSELWDEKVFVTPTKDATNAMKWGVENESAAIDRYKAITGQEVTSLGFAIHSDKKLDWLGASPDGIIDCVSGNGILEVKCPFNNGDPQRGLPWRRMHAYYMPQVQGILEILDREWADLYCWTPNGSKIFRVYRDRDYWEMLSLILHEFWWKNVVPAREALSLGKEDEVASFKPVCLHKLSSKVRELSSKLASDSALLCEEINGKIEFYTR